MLTFKLKKVVFTTYKLLVRTGSETGITGALLPLPLRRKLKAVLDRGIRALTRIDASKPYYVLGHRMWLHPGKSALQSEAFGTYEYDTVEVFSDYIRPGMTVVDVGAFVGFYTLLSARLVGPQGSVYAFEPNPEAFALLRRNIHENGYGDRVTAVPKAVSKAGGKAQLFLNRANPGMTSLYGQGREIDVETISLDDFFWKEGWPQVDFAKVDVEGGEVQVLHGMSEVVRRNPHMALVIEFNPSAQVTAIGDYETFFRTLQQLGFNKFRMIRHGVRDIAIPTDIPMLAQLADIGFINLFCRIDQMG